MILLCALAADLLIGDPPNRWHPVAWIGRVLGWLFARGPRAGRLPTIAYGAAVVTGVAATVAGTLWALEPSLNGLGWVGTIAQAWILKCSFSLRGLWIAARQVEAALERGDLARARELVGQLLVSRPTRELTVSGVSSAAVESVAENLTDSVVAPSLCYLLFGLAGAWAYRVINTADAMVGYRAGRLEFLGKAAARLDDAVNWLPARLSALAIVAGSGLAGEDARGALRVMAQDHRRTASPNAGWTMAAMAGALGIALERAGAYRLGAGRCAGSHDIRRSRAVLAWSAAAALAMVLGVAWLFDLVVGREGGW